METNVIFLDYLGYKLLRHKALTLYILIMLNTPQWLDLYSDKFTRTSTY